MTTKKKISLRLVFSWMMFACVCSFRAADFTEFISKNSSNIRFSQMWNLKVVQFNIILPVSGNSFKEAKAIFCHGSNDGDERADKRLFSWARH